MRFSAYSALNGACSTFIGVLFVIAGFPGLFKDTAGGYAWVALPGIAVVLVPLALLARSRGIPLAAPGRWLTDRAILRARPAQSTLAEPRLRARLLIETALWSVLAIAVIAGFSTSRPFAYATGWASLAYGLLELLASAPQIRRAEHAAATTYLIHRRPGMGAPQITTP